MSPKIKLVSDCLMNMDRQEITLLIMIDLSAAFDTVDHVIMLEQLTSRFGVDPCGSVYQWFRDYLSGRQRAVRVDKTL